MERNQTEFIYPSIYLSIYPPTYAINLLIIDLLTNGSPFGWRVLLRRSPISIYLYLYIYIYIHYHKPTNTKRGWLAAVRIDIKIGSI